MADIDNTMLRARDLTVQAFTGERPIYFEGQKIGYWKDAKELCRGIIYLYSGSPPKSDPTKWVTTDYWGFKNIPVTTLCVGYNLRPVWVSEKELTQYQINPPVVQVTSVKNEYIKWGVIGGLGLIALVLVTRR